MFKNKYLKYKEKYLDFKNKIAQKGGAEKRRVETDAEMRARLVREMRGDQEYMSQLEKETKMRLEIEREIQADLERQIRGQVNNPRIEEINKRIGVIDIEIQQIHDGIKDHIESFGRLTYEEQEEYDQELTPLNTEKDRLTKELKSLPKFINDKDARGIGQNNNQQKSAGGQVNNSQRGQVNNSQRGQVNNPRIEEINKRIGVIDIEIQQIHDGIKDHIESFGPLDREEQEEYDQDLTPLNTEKDRLTKELKSLPKFINDKDARGIGQNNNQQKSAGGQVNNPQSAQVNNSQKTAGGQVMHPRIRKINERIIEIDESVDNVKSDYGNRDWEEQDADNKILGRLYTEKNELEEELKSLPKFINEREAREIEERQREYDDPRFRTFKEEILRGKFDPESIMAFYDKYDNGTHKNPSDYHTYPGKYSAVEHEVDWPYTITYVKNKAWYESRDRGEIQIRELIDYNRYYERESTYNKDYDDIPNDEERDYDYKKSSYKQKLRREEKVKYLTELKRQSRTGLLDPEQEQFLSNTRNRPPHVGDLTKADEQHFKSKGLYDDDFNRYKDLILEPLSFIVPTEGGFYIYSDVNRWRKFYSTEEEEYFRYRLDRESRERGGRGGSMGRGGSGGSMGRGGSMGSRY